MTEYLVVSMKLNDWQSNGHKIKKMINDKKLFWNSNKVKELNTSEVSEIYKKFCIDSCVDSYDTTKEGKEGVWGDRIKIVISDNDVHLIFKEMYSDIIKTCKDLGYLITLIDIVNDTNIDIKFRDKINVDLLKRLNDLKGEKDIMEKNFRNRTTIDNNNFSEIFTNKWINCIIKNRN